MMDDKTKRTILIVDDVPENIDILGRMLSDEYKVKASISGEKALRIAEAADPPDLILLDIVMPGLDGHEVCRRLKQTPATKAIPVIFVTARDDEQDEALGLELGAVDYISKPASTPIVRARVKTHLALYDQNRTLEEKVRERTRELSQVKEATIECLAALAEHRDPETGNHIRRTQKYVRLLAERLQNHPRFKLLLDPDAIELLHKSAPLHDIGKVGVRDALLFKPGKLTPEEFEEMKSHAAIGRDALATAEKRLGGNCFLHLAGIMAYSHHEKWDGSGYPEGLKGDDIPLCGRIMAAADVYDALISRRVYKPPLPHRRAVEIMAQGRGSHFDPDVLDAFLDLREEFRQTALELHDSEEERRGLE
ncbi:MAG: HD domain-containing phosphohydrolase [Pseudomonadota bacterium]